jgi:hypothetical protein
VTGIASPPAVDLDRIRRYIDAASIDAADRKKIFEDNARRVHARMQLAA